LLIGSSNTSWGGLPLPFDLSAIGFPGGCLLAVSPDVAVPGLTDANGEAALPLVIRGDFSAAVYWQWIVLGQGAGFGLTGGLLTLVHR
jgi:hypothetical protein